MGGGDSSPPPLQAPFPQAPDPFATAQAQTGYNINTATAQNLLNNTNQITPYGDITYNQTGQQLVGTSPGTPAKPATGGFWNGQMWVPTGGTPAVPGNPGWEVPTYTATTQLSPEMQAILSGQQNVANKQNYNAARTNDLYAAVMNRSEGDLSQPLNLSWGNLQNNIFGLERNSLDPYWKWQQAQQDQSLASQGLTPGSEGYTAQQTQFGLNKNNAYDQAMLQAQGQAASDITAQYYSPLQVMSSLRGGQQSAPAQQQGVGQPAATASASVSPSPYAQIAQSNYGTAANMYDAALQQQTSLENAKTQQQSQEMGGLFSLGGSLLGAIPGIISSDRRDKTDIKRLGIEKETNLPMYSYRYKDDPKTYPKVVGPMAQDIEKKYPDSVGEVGGHKVVFGLGGSNG